MQVFNYENCRVTFVDENGTLMVNATEMAKPFIKRPVDWLQNSQTQHFLNELTKVRKSTLEDIVKVSRGGSNAGTWFHEDVALEFARWLSPSFAIWCNDRIKELMRYGFTATDQKLEEIANNPDLLIQLATNLKKERQEKERLLTEVKKLEPKAEYLDVVLKSVDTLTTTSIASELGMTAQALNKELVVRKIQRKVDKHYVLTAEYVNKGYASNRTHTRVDSEGIVHTSQLLVWTEYGKAFLHTLFNEKLSFSKVSKNVSTTYRVSH